MREGIALVVTLVVLLLVETMAVGMLALAAQTRLVADAQLRKARTNAAAAYAATSVMAHWGSAGFDTLPAGAVVVATPGSGSADGVSWSATVERAERSVFVLRTEARTGESHAATRSRVLAVVRMLDREAVLRDFNAAITSGGQLVLANQTRISSGAAELPPGPACPPLPYLPAPAALRSAAPPAVSETVEISGDVVVDSMLALESSALGNLMWRDMPQLADTTVAEALTLAVPDSTYPLIFSPGDLVVTGGVGQGFIIAAGMLTITEAARFHGLIVARDGIWIEPGAEIYGAVAARQGHAVIDDATVRFSRCAVYHALQLTPAAQRPVFGPRRYLPAF